jgi:hypothetical protein
MRGPYDKNDQRPTSKKSVVKNFAVNDALCIHSGGYRYLGKATGGRRGVTGTMRRFSPWAVAMHAELSRLRCLALRSSVI